MGPAAARAYLCLGLFVTGAYVAIGGSNLVYESLGLLAAAAIACGTLVHRPAARAGWLLLALSQGLLGVGDLLYFNAYGDAPPYPSAADGFYLVGIVMFGTAIVTIVARSEYGRDLLSYGDALVVALAIGSLVWAAMLSGSVGSGQDLARAVSIAQPVLELGLLAALLRVFFVRGTRTVSYYALVASVTLLIVSDIWYVVPALTDAYVAGSWRDAGWLLSYILAGAAGLHPSMQTFVKPKPAVLNARRVILLGLSLTAIATSFIFEESLSSTTNVYALAGASALAALFVVLRVVGVIRALERTTAAVKESERRLRMIFERSPIGISVGRDGIMTETNPALQRMLGYTAEEFAGTHYSAVTHPDDRALDMQMELDRGARDAFSTDKRYIAKDGHAIDVRVHVALDLEDGLGISLMEDVTQQRELEEQLRQAQKLEAVGKLAGGIAHDFNNLMTAVLGYSDLVLRGLGRDDPDRARLEAIKDAAVRASDLTRQLLAFGRRQLMQATDVDVREVVERVGSLLEASLGEDIRLETDLGADAVVVRVDPTQLEQVVMNLAVNAREAMPDGGILRIAVASAGNCAVLSVEDGGDGMDPGTQERIFEPFFTTKGVGASGLGLSTVHGVIGQSGGMVELESAPGHGSRFTIRLPLAGLTPALPGRPRPATLLTD